MQRTTEGVLGAAALALLLIGGVLLLSRPRVGSDGGTSSEAPGAEGRSDAPRRLRGEARSAGAVLPTPHEDTAVEAALADLDVALAAKDVSAIQEAIAGLARAICGHPGQAEALVDLAAAKARAGALRHAADVLHAMGRCADPHVIGVLVEALRREDLPASLRPSLVLSLAQRREPDLRVREVPAFSKGDTSIQGPIAEPEVRAVLLDLLEETLLDPSRYHGETMSNCLLALGASAGTDGRVLEAFRAIVTTKPDLAPTALLALRMPGREEATTALARQVIFAESSAEQAVRAAVGLLMAVDPEAGLAAVLPLLSDPDVEASRKLVLLDGMTGLPVVSDALIPDLEAAVRAADAWTREARTLTTLEKSGMAPDAPLVAHDLDLRPHYATFLRGAVMASRGRSAFIDRMGADALAATLLAPPPMKKEHLARMVQDQIEGGGPAFLDAFLATLERSAMADDHLASALLGIRRGSGPRWTSLRARVVALAERLPAEARKAVLTELQ